MSTQPGADIPSCSFCLKPHDQVNRLINGPNGVAICDQCVELAREIIAEELTEPDGER